MIHFFSLDYRLFSAMNSWTNAGPVFDAVAVFCARDLVVLVAAGLVLYWVLARDKFMVRKSLVVAFLSFVFSRFVVDELIRLLVREDRPFVTHTVIQLLTKGNEPSFPSGHMTAMAAIATALYFYHPKLGIWMWAAAWAIGAARVVVGVHYPVDIVGGAVVGWLSAYCIHRYYAPKLNKTVYVISRKFDKIFSYL